jgi:uracil-DNA glycosylase
VPKHGDLEAWAKQGVLLLNAVLTVRHDMAASHSKQGWEKFTDEAIRQLSHKRSGIIFLLWGRLAQDKLKLIDCNKHHVLQAAHPSGLSAHRGFLGCKHFSRTNEILSSEGKDIIQW